MAEQGRVVGVIPEFMVKLEWVNPNLPETIVVHDMHERKKRMMDCRTAVIALPGGCGTLEELMEAITWKRLGLYLGPIVILNTQSYYQPLISLLDQCIGERFMDSRHARMWSVVERAGGSSAGHFRRRTLEQGLPQLCGACEKSVKLLEPADCVRRALTMETK